MHTSTLISPSSAGNASVRLALAAYHEGACSVLWVGVRGMGGSAMGVMAPSIGRPPARANQSAIGSARLSFTSSMTM